MAYNDKADLGNHVQFTPKTSATRRGVPTAIQELSRTETAPAVENLASLKRTGASVRALRDLNKHTVKTKI